MKTIAPSYATWIKSGDREFLAWSKSDLKVGTSVEFSIDQLQAVRVKVVKQRVSEVVEVLTEPPEPEMQPEPKVIEEVEEPTTSMAAAFKRISKS